MVRLTLKRKNVCIKCDLLLVKRYYPELTFDKRRLQQVLLNLLSNAVKFQNTGVIKVSAQVMQKDTDLFLEVTVKDRGAGMTEE